MTTESKRWSGVHGYWYEAFDRWEAGQLRITRAFDLGGRYETRRGAAKPCSPRMFRVIEREAEMLMADPPERELIKQGSPSSGWKHIVTMRGRLYGIAVEVREHSKRFKRGKPRASSTKAARP